MKPVVAIVGRPNVGKSTLFNRLTRSRSALVADIPGLTRDRQYGDGRLGARPYLVVDTGGLVESLHAPGAGRAAAALSDQIMSQTRQALAEADAVILLVDARAGVHPVDSLLATDLRRLGKPVVLAVNKAEGVEPEVAAAEFHGLGLGPPQTISASHGDGVEPMIERVLDLLPEAELPEEVQQADVPRIAVIGRPNAGKSTLVNALLGEPRVLVGSEPGTTRDSICVPLERDGRPYVLIDTAGVRRRGRIEDAIEHYSVAKTLQAIDEANVVILVLDADAGVAEQDAAIAGYALEQGRAMVIAANKWELLDPGRRDWFRRELERKLPFLAFAKVHTISALEGKGVGELFRSVDTAFASATQTLSTPKLTRALQAAVQANPPPLIRGRRPRPKYAHQGGRNPPRVIVHGNQVGALSASYRRYLSGVFRDAFRLVGTPVVIECRQESNPYKEPGRRKKTSRARFKRKK
ncbi:MAG: ribosome biogenesis GTPase Der [Gammaproteobacteria bacterium]|nr:MAG: ribosome biogenesis GTPase Der [Gammaproteobacteria bacterium]